MAITLDDYLSRLPDHERETIETRTSELILEEATLRELREALDQSQQQLAERLGIQQAAVSRLERRTDMYLSTLRELIRSLGGELDIVARFPDRPAVRITQFRSLRKGIRPSS